MHSFTIQNGINLPGESKKKKKEDDEGGEKHTIIGWGLYFKNKKMFEKLISISK